VRPRFSALDSERGRLMPTLEDGIVSYISEATLFATQVASNMERV
jgi:hypothetical protein